MIRAACASSIGMRPTHEDNYLLNGKILDAQTQKNMNFVKTVQYQSVCSQKVNIIAVSDGMGGHNAGEIASRFCVLKLAEVEKNVQNCANLQEVIDIVQQEIALTNNDICCESRKNTALYGMGATSVVFISYKNDYAILNIGDSRAYSFCGDIFIQLTKDHTEGQRLLDLGILSRKELENFPARKHLNRYWGYDVAGYILQADVFYLESKPCLILLCSDGVTDALSEKIISDILFTERDIWNASKKIVDAATCSTCADNATVILVDIRG